MKKLLAFLVVLTVSVCNLNSQNKTIKGRVIDDYLETLPYVPIFIKDTLEIGKTDLDGFFQIDIPANENKILFRYVGIDPTTIELVDQCNEIEVIMMLTGTHDFISLKRAEKKREKRYKMLLELHKQAHENGLFKSEKPCYAREFESYYLDKN
ncbi:carboxypeptidase-like regulatory domain-containing protein [Salinimicrobium gaetbulicola]|uniref:Carboxypeptidase-like regulatory domain-containing protein n=1 Tax=Salinimicrobium gaetbulicola TaxID=999702 RepID=A0ABW3IBK4_9FLAO